MAVSVQGTVETRRTGDARWLPARLHDVYCAGDMLRVDARSRAGIRLRGGSVLRLDQNTTITFSAPRTQQASWVELLRGVVHFLSRVTRGLTVQTPFVNATVQGTEFWIAVTRDETAVTVLEGRVAASNEAGGVVVASGQSAVARAGQAPAVRPVVVSPVDAVQWALYYPVVLDLHAGDFPDRPGESWPALVRQSLEAYAEGDLDAAFARIAAVPPGVTDPRFFAYRAGLLLAVGRLDEAVPDIDRAQALDPRSSQAAALRTVVAVARNDGAGALRLGRRAVELDAASATAQIALSYAQQAGFDLEGALASARAAVAARPDRALPRARLAELWLAVGELDRALEAALEGARLEPDLARAQTVLGFAYLSQIRTKEAAAAFARAIERDQGDPLPRLGLGLAKIRDGDLEAGREEIETAVSLDPASSLLRSYLGKAYHEEKRERPAAEELALARRLDDKDPTPWFYDAIRLQSENRPVEALESLQRSIELNDNRAVYRSRLLLDQDLGARGAALGRIYSDVGFQQLGLVEGWKSLGVDPGNYSAHRLLADSYAVLPRHERARASELLQSQLLQPVNIAPVQPQLAESELLILDGLGPSEPSLNEFNPLFLRNRLALQASGIAASHGTIGDELVQSGVWGPLSYSLGQFHIETDGFRQNDDLKEDIYDAFLQASLSPRTSVQLEFRRTSTERGDRTVRFLSDDFLPNERHDDDTESVRVGFHHTLAPGSDVIASFIYRDLTERLRDVNPVLSINSRTEQTAFLGEAQHLYAAGRWRVVSGVGHLSGERKETSTLAFSGTSPSTTEDTADIRDTSVYVYSYLTYPDTLTVTLGVSADFLEDAFVDRDQVNPKFGLVWNASPGTTVRAAVFRVLSRPTIDTQTIEPTQVAGFNQVFGTKFENLDFPGTGAWRYGVAVDQEVTRNVYAGAEFSKQDLTVRGQQVSADTTVRVEESWDEYLARAYFYWTPHPWLAASAEYQFERFDRGALLGAGTGILESDTHRLGLGVTVFHPSGFTFGVKATYVDQAGTFVPRIFQSGSSLSGSDQFWVTDVFLRYRLPRRLGFVTVGVKNLFDERFHFQDTDPANPLIEPERAVFARITLAF
jgi:ferric-dicitrate binding protein FerR (iron transport regulator)